MGIYTCAIFQDLLSNFGTWESLSSFLQSDEGGKLRVISDENNKPLVIIRYVKGQSDLYNEKKPWVGWFRSVVWNTETNRPVSIAPRKAMSGDIPTDRSLIVEEFVEGVMVNTFYVPGQMVNFDLATRSSLRAETAFYSQKTFREMFMEALTKQGFTFEWLSDQFREKSEGTSSVFASFVLQHPDHRVVQKITEPSLKMVLWGTTGSDGQVTFLDSDSFLPGTDWLIPKYVDLVPGQSAQDLVNQMSQQKENSWQGLVFRDSSNGAMNRWRIRSMAYKILRELRGKESRQEERFVRLRNTHMLRFYTQTFQEEQPIFFEFEKRLRALTAKIYKEYCSVHKEKSKTQMDLPVPLRSPVYALQGIYLNTLRPKKLTLKMPNVITYVNSLSPEVLGPLLRMPIDLTIHEADV